MLKTCSDTQLWSNGLGGRTDQIGTTMGLGDFALFVERIMSSRAAVLIIAQIELRSDLLQVWHRNSRAHWTGMSSWAPGVHGGVVLKSKEWEWNQFLADTWRVEGRVKNLWSLQCESCRHPSLVTLGVTVIYFNSFNLMKQLMVFVSTCSMAFTQCHMPVTWSHSLRVQWGWTSACYRDVARNSHWPDFMSIPCLH